MSGSKDENLVVDKVMLRTFMDYHTGVRHTVHKSKHRLARCRFVMLYKEPEQAPLPSKGLALARLHGVDQPAPVPVYGLTDESWKVEVTCCKCHQCILDSASKCRGAKLRDARKRRAVRMLNNGNLPPELLCAACDPDVVAEAAAPKLSVPGKKRASSSFPLTVDVGGASVLYRAQPTSTQVALDEPDMGSPNTAARVSKTCAGVQNMTPTSSADPRCPFCNCTMQSAKRFGRHWQKFGYQGVYTPTGAALPLTVFAMGHAAG